MLLSRVQIARSTCSYLPTSVLPPTPTDGVARIFSLAQMALPGTKTQVYSTARTSLKDLYSRPFTDWATAAVAGTNTWLLSFLTTETRVLLASTIMGKCYGEILKYKTRNFYPGGIFYMCCQRLQLGPGTKGSMLFIYKPGNWLLQLCNGLTKTQSSCRRWLCRGRTCRSREESSRREMSA